MKDNVLLNETMFVIGSGPSLNAIDIKKLEGLHTISLNRQYIAYEDWGFWPKYHACIDIRLIHTIYESDLLPMMLDPECEIERFFIYGCSNLEVPEDVAAHYNIQAGGLPEKLIWIPAVGSTFRTPAQRTKTIPKLETCYVDPELVRERLSTHLRDPSDPYSCLEHFGISGAWSVTLARSLGYKRVVVLGIDANYVPRDESISAGRDLNHFHKNYFDVDTFVYQVNFGPAIGYLEPWKIMATGTDLNDQPVPCVSPGAAHVCADETIEVISSSPGSPINKWFEYIDFNKLLESYEAQDEY